jgi:hypothetical protein
MTTRSATVRAIVVLAAAGALLLTGCGQQQDERRPASNAAPAAAPPAPAEPAAAAAASAPAPAADVEEEVPVEVETTVLPPGDPGLDAPSVPDPGKPKGDHHHDEPARTVVPGEALLDPQSMSVILGGEWERSAGEPLGCLAGARSVGELTALLRTDGGEVLETLSTHDSPEAADRAVGEQLAALEDCGWTRDGAPRLGWASAAATSPDRSQSAVVVSAEGVMVSLVGSGSVTADRRRLMTVVDLALGNSCAAAPEACHDQESGSEH